MKNTKFVMQVNRSGIRATEYVTRIDRSPVGTTLKTQSGTSEGEIHGRRCSPILGEFPVQPGTGACPGSRITQSACRIVKRGDQESVIVQL